MDWNYFKIRRRTTLENFLSGVTSETEALQLFVNKGVDNPPLEEIKWLFAPKKAVPEVVQVLKEIPSVEISNEKISTGTLLPKKAKVVSGSSGN